MVLELFLEWIGETAGVVIPELGAVGGIWMRCGAIMGVVLRRLDRWHGSREAEKPFRLDITFLECDDPELPGIVPDRQCSNYDTIARLRSCPRIRH